MSQSPLPNDSFDPSERMPAVRARVPEHVATGQISTGVIVVTGATEFILDFVRNLPRPNMIVARVVLPHSVMPQFTDALTTNINLYRQRFGDLGVGPIAAPSPMVPQLNPTVQLVSAAGSTIDSQGPTTKPSGSSASGGISSHSVPDTPKIHNEAGTPIESQDRTVPGQATPPGHTPSPGSSISRHASPQEVYDELKLRDELLSGTYANAVMIGHGPHEFCFDFITNFYPQSAVSCRVFMAAGHVGRLLESLRASWEQLRPRLGGNP